jgi:hypothetical protein
MTETTDQPLDPAAIMAAQVLEASRSAEGGSPWVVAYDGDYYVHNGYSRIASATFSEEVADLIAAGPHLAHAVIRLAEALQASERALHEALEAIGAGATAHGADLVALADARAKVQRVEALVATWQGGFIGATTELRAAAAAVRAALAGEDAAKS